MPYKSATTLVLLVLLTLAFWGTAVSHADDTKAAAAEVEEGWEVLFDGSSTEAFRSWKSDAFPKQGWVIEQDGTLHAMDGGHDIITRKQYRDFDLRLEWKIAAGANSGIMYRVSEKGSAPHVTGPEYQIIDDKRIHNSSTASLYDLITPNDKVKLNPPGEWNTTRIVLHNNQCQHYLNGELVVEYVWASDEIKALIAKSKFRKWDGFMKQDIGHIALQCHGKDLWFRNIKIKELSQQ